MSDYVLSCCSTADLTKDYFESRKIHYICFHFEIDGEQYPDDLGESMPLAEFYRRMKEGAMTRTSQVSAGEYEAYFEGFLRDGLDVLHLTLSSGISGTLNSAKVAQETLQKKYPERKIYVIDSLAASAGFGLFMDALADLRDEGRTIDELRDWACAHRLNCLHWFFTSDLTYLIRGGRVSKTAGFFGKVLNICPLLNVDVNGALAPREKIRTKNRVIKETVRHMIEDADGGTSYTGKVFISNSACYEDARAVADLVEENFPNMNGKVRIFDIGTTIGSHTGPGTVALFFWGKKRAD